MGHVLKHDLEFAPLQTFIIDPTHIGASTGSPWISGIEAKALSKSYRQ